ncbi:MAG: ectoine/hydroxyectoine ABC transporter substrate-binding protein EhuB [Nitriliruptor sp.]|uniref:ectoine/hydroxyectoine ABC transporter substrate-binding protein EhuB n=1 Tax=Nitriliruptor sp. TaxID=2448056 RepID=UPI0034A087F0
MRIHLSRTRRLRAVVAPLLATGLLLTACGGGDDDTTSTDDGGSAGEASGIVAEYQESGVTLGVANEVPFGSVGEDGEATGIGPDVARAVLDEMGIAVNDAQVVEFGELIGGLQAGQFDIITAGMYITPERAEQVFFSDPDYCVAESLGVPTGNPEGVTDYQSIVDNSDLTVAVATGTVEVGYVEEAGIPAEQVETFGDIESMYRALEAGEVDAVTGTAATVNTQADARDGIDAVEGFFPTTADGEEILPCGGHAFADEEFRDAFNEVLNGFREDGTTADIILQYDEFTEADVEMANELTVADLS